MEVLRTQRFSPFVVRPQSPTLPTNLSDRPSAYL